MVNLTRLLIFLMRMNDMKEKEWILRRMVEVHSFSYSIESTNSVHFSSPFISVSFKALIEKPSERGLSMCTDLSHLEWNDSSVLRKRIEKAIVVESPPRKRPSIQCVRESPISNHRVNIMFPFRMTG